MSQELGAMMNALTREEREALTTDLAKKKTAISDLRAAIPTKSVDDILADMKRAMAGVKE